ncbi:ABC transporter ATP-binding protein [Caenimonas soli]|uniref:ABC transporter ATP-binding protein n=1 Tax=Caenimonas soli TaxID=2735555 RepID=UPI00155334CB|nr:ATP-binding cassette domain-containing protein [Caenimonas soli]NPC57259.1 ATP-binding cassette domain-containing protein [Caenimonas soli]
MIQSSALRYDYPRGPSLAFPDLDVPQGATLLLRGNSGAGKSTWLALAAGLLTAGAGDIVVAGQSLSALSRAARDGWRARHLGFLPQKLHLSDALSVERNLALAFYAAGLPEKQGAVHHALEQLGVAELAERRPSQLSGGQAQRVALARSILMEPQVILADEPTASLDDEAALAGLKLLESCAFRCNATLVIATHDRRVQEALPAAIVYRIGSA